MHRKENTAKAFTLIELIVVIAIIGVLAAILVPSMVGYVGASKIASANANAKLAFSNAANYVTDCEVAGYTISQDVYKVFLQTDHAGSNAYDRDGTQLPGALQSMMGSPSEFSGYTILELDAGLCKQAFWAKTEVDQYVGHYPGESLAKGDFPTVGEDCGLTLTQPEVNSDQLDS